MAIFICRCPETQQPVDLQLCTDYATLARTRSNSVRFQCPHCGAEHETKMGKACLEDTLARTSSSETHAGSARHAVADICMTEFGERGSAF